MIQASQWYRHARTLRCVVHEWVCDISFTILGPFHYKLIVSLKLPFRCLMSVDTCRLLFLFILTNTVCIACLNDTGVLDRALCCWWYEWDFFHNLGLLHCANQIIECFFQCDLTYECFSVNQAIIVRFLSWWTLDLYVSLVSMIDTGMRRHRTVLYVTDFFGMMEYPNMIQSSSASSGTFLLYLVIYCLCAWFLCLQLTIRMKPKLVMHLQRHSKLDLSKGRICSSQPRLSELQSATLYSGKTTLQSYAWSQPMFLFFSFYWNVCVCYACSCGIQIMVM